MLLFCSLRKHPHPNPPPSPPQTGGIFDRGREYYLPTQFEKEPIFWTPAGVYPREGGGGSDKVIAFLSELVVLFHCQKPTCQENTEPIRKPHQSISRLLPQDL